MPPGNPSRLLRLAEREFRQLTTVRPASSPSPRRFKASKVNISKFDSTWDRQRGAAVRLMAVILREDSESLYDKVSADPKTAATFADAVSWLANEAVYLRKIAARQDLAVSRLSSAVERYQAATHHAPVAPSAPAEASAP